MAESGNNEVLKKQHALEKVRPYSLSLYFTEPSSDALRYSSSAWSSRSLLGVR